MSESWFDPFPAYVAGFFDGEGCVCIDSFRPKNCKTRNCHRFRITFTNTNRTVLDAILDRWPGGSMRITPKGKGATRDCYQLSYSTKAARPLLHSIGPWLRIKREEAALAADFLETLATENRGRGGIPDSVWNYRQSLLERLRALRGYPRP